MKRLTFAAALLLALLSPAFAQSGPISCPSSAIYDASTNGATKLVTGLSTRNIYICGYQLFGGGTASVSLVSGTGTNCGSNQVAVTPAYPLIAQVGVADQSPVFRGLVVARALDLCIKTSAGVAVQGVVYYSQE